MRSGEGLVGLIASEAEPLNLSDAQAHPAFSYLPETGEEIYNSFLGVPILRAGDTLGVLVVQNRAQRIYTRGGDRGAADHRDGARRDDRLRRARRRSPGRAPTSTLRRPVHLTGVGLADGVGLGHVVLHEPRVVVNNLIAEDTDARDASGSRRRSAALRALDRRHARRAATSPSSGEHREVLETYRMFAHDRGWLRRLREAVAHRPDRGGRGRAGAVATRAPACMRMTDPYLRERLHDLDDLANRLLRQLIGRRPRRAGAARCPRTPSSSPARWAPAELLDYDRARLRGLVLEEGGPTSHVAIVARALGIPAVGEVEGVIAIVENGDAIIVDGDGGRGPAAPAARRRGAPMPRRCASAPAGRSSTGRCATCRPSPRDGVRDRPADQCRAAGRPAASRGERALPASACSAPSCSS